MVSKGQGLRKGLAERARVVCDCLNVEANKTPKIQMTRGVEERSDRVKPGRQVVQYYRVRRKALFFAGRFFWLLSR